MIVEKNRQYIETEYCRLRTRQNDRVPVDFYRVTWPKGFPYVATEIKTKFSVHRVPFYKPLLGIAPV